VFPVLIFGILALLQHLGVQTKIIILEKVSSYCLAMSSPYQYSPLESSDHIRLLHVKPGTGNEPIACEIYHVSLVDSPVYEALSCTWELDEPTGEPPQHHSIACGEFHISIAPNLFSALRQLRKDAEDLVLWADAACIYFD
jgi:hypothetical protein